MSLTLLFGLMTLVPAVIAIILGILARVSSFRLPSLAAMGLAAVAAILPIVGLILLTSDLAFATPVRFAFAGDSTTPFAPLFRADGLSFYAGWGIAVLIVPLLLWAIWMDAGRTADAAGRLVAELALTVGIEACALQLVFSDNLLWLGLVWVVLVALAWLLGEQGAESGELDYLGLASMLIGPVISALLLLLIAIATKDHTFFDLTGHAAASTWQVFLLAIALTLAGGGYPFAAWVRRRAAFTTPSGFIALMVVVLPTVVFVGTRAWGALQDSRGLWPEIGAVTPPITAGIALAVLGTLTIAISGLLALGRRDGRTLVALLATAQVGWGLLALGASKPGAGVGAVVLLATGIVGLGAMSAALIAGGVLTADDELDGAGPVPFGLTSRPLNLIAWCIGAATALGVPFFGGFVARHLITAGSLAGTKLGIPLLGLAWLGDALFAVALIRATVLAFKDDPTEAAETDANDADNADNADVAAASRRSTSVAELVELPGVVLALIGLALGIFPQTFLSMGALFATNQITPDGAVDAALHIVPFGYSTGNSQWLPGIFWLAALVLAAAVVLIRLGAHRTPVTLETSGDAELTGMGAEALDEPAAVWLDLVPAFTSPWTQVAGRQLIGGIDEDDEYTEALADEEEDDGEDEIAAGDSTPPDDTDGSATSADAAADTVVAGEASAEETPVEETTPEASPTNQPTTQSSKQSPNGGRKNTKQGTRNADKRGQVRK